MTPLRQIERLYGSILRTASLLARLGESSERLEHLLRSSAAEINTSVAAASNILGERIEVSSAQLRDLNAKLSHRVEQPQPQPPHHEIQQYLTTLQADLARTTPGNPAVKGWRSYSQCDEDGIIRECLQRIEQQTPLSHTFIEVGCADGLENNTHQLVLDGFAGCWIDGDPDKIRFIEQELGNLQMPALKIRQAFLTLESIEGVIKDCRAFIGTDDVDFFSFDIDGT